MSTEYHVESTRDGKTRICDFEFGHLVKDKTKTSKNKSSGTYVSFIPNEEILGKIKPVKEDVLELCETMSYLTKIEILCSYTNRKGKEEIYKFKSKNGIRDLLNNICEDKIVKPVYIYEEQVEGNIKREVEICFTYSANISEHFKDYIESDGSIIFSYINFCTTVEHGTHVQGMRQGLSNVILKNIKEKYLNKKEQKLELIPEDTRDGLVAIINVNTTEDLSFGGQSKTKLKTDAILPFVRNVVNKKLPKYFSDDEKSMAKIADWVKSMAKARLKSNEEKKSIIRTKGFDNPFSKDKPKNWKKANGKEHLELFIIEGDSASSGAKQTRNKEFQELFSLKGVPLNTIDMTMARALENAEIRGLVTIIGTGTGKNCDPSKCRYDRIIIATDADSDGYKITSLLSAFFVTHMAPLVEAGIIYKVMPPLYKISLKGKTKYIKDNKEYSEIIKDSIANSMDIYVEDKETKKTFKMSKDDISNLIINTKNYLRSINKLSRKLVCNPDLIEDVIYNYNDLNNKKFLKKFKKKYPYMELDVSKNGTILNGFVNKEFQYIKINNHIDELIRELNEYLIRNNYLTKKFIVEDNKLHLYKLLKLFESFEPAGKQRFKGLGEMNPDELNETTLMPDNRILVRLTTDDINKESETMELLHGKSLNARNERRNLMSKFKIDLDELDT